MEVGWFEVKLVHFGVRDLDSRGIGLARHLRFDLEARFAIHPEQLNVPLLFFTSNRENFIEDIEHSDMDMTGHNVLNEWTHADVMTVNMLGMSHPEFCSMCERFKTPKDFAEEDQVADYGRNDANTSYSWVALYTLQFLNAYLKHDGSAKAFLARTPAENDVPRHFMGIRFSPKSFAEIMRSAARTGEESAWKAFQTFAADPMHRYMIGEERTINRLGYAFLQERIRRRPSCCSN